MRINAQVYAVSETVSSTSHMKEPAGGPIAVTTCGFVIWCAKRDSNPQPTD